VHDRLTVPVLLLLAADADAGRFAERVSQATVVRLDSGHDVIEDQPAETARLVADWLAERSFSHAIAEGDGISVIAAVEDADAARAAEAQRAEALVVSGHPAAVRDATTLPILWRTDVAIDEAAGSADAYLLVFDALEDEDGRLEELHGRVVSLGLDCAVEVRDEDEIEKALERVDPEIFVLSPVEADRDESPLDVVLDLLADVPAGKLAIADLPRTTPAEVEQLERAGCDGVIVHSRDLSPLVGAPVPEV
jgi:indole-3-glycerol phosphate synthase